EENQWVVQYCKQKQEAKHRDYYVFGHRHLLLNIDINETSKYINLGDWISYYTYGVFDGDVLELKKYEYLETQASFSCSSISFLKSNFLNDGDTIPVVITVSSVIVPPKTTAVTVPISLAVTPLSKAPNSFEEPTNIEFTEDTRPLI